MATIHPEPRILPENSFRDAKVTGYTASDESDPTLARISAYVYGVRPALMTDMPLAALA
jgi:hypothetical protein